MFRLESYITPIILNYVAKYVKNVRPQDAQVSLWEGEVAFQNLDLRLDVLEQELNLPFEFLSGHIHELIIHVPWTKINSEPINITINTIEFVLKLKDPHSRDTAGSPTNLQSPQKIERKKRLSRLEESQPGYNTSGLVSKIINNITIDCHNIILKYVEEDIVVSMNVQLLSLHSVDEDWNPAFVDIHPLKRLIRKIIEVSDLTICLDKRNSMGHIEVCQEPILYKCSLQIRVILKSSNSIKETRVAVLTNFIEMNISSIQFPMVLRLLNLVLALKTGELKVVQDIEETYEVNDEFNSSLADSTWGTFIWNMLPNIFADTEEESKIEDNTENLLDVGLYIESLKLTLKSLEFVSESIVGSTKKIRYNPIISFLFKGIFIETVIDDKKDWFSSKIGISKISVEALGHFCEDTFDKYLIKSNRDLKGNFLFESLFDNSSQLKSPITNITEYLDKNTEEYLNNRAACFNLNITKYKRHNEELPSENNVDEIIYRLLLSSITLCYNTTASKIIDTISDLIAIYDYPPYIPITNDRDNKLPPPILEDYDSLMAEVPVKVFNFSVRNFILKVFPKEELYVRNQNRLRVVQKVSKRLIGKLSFLSLNIQFFSGKWITPQDPALLVHTTCQLPKQPPELLNACYDNFFINVKHISINLCDNCLQYPILSIPTARAKICNLLYPHLWQNQNIAQLKMNFSIQDFVITFTKPRLILSLQLIKTITSFNYNIIMRIVESSIKNEIHKNLYELENFGKFFEVNINVFDKSISTRGRLRSVKSNIIKNDMTKLILMETAESDSCHKASNNASWIEWSAQIPKDYKNLEYSTFLFLNIQNYNIFLNECLVEFLRYEETKAHFDRDISPNRESKLGSEKNTERKSVKKSFASSSRKISHPEETIHLSSEKDETIENLNIKKIQDNTDFSCRTIIYLLKHATLNINVNQGAIYFVDEYATTNHEYEICAIWTPRISCKSSISENFDLSKSFPIKNSSNILESFPWTCNITSLSVSLKTKEGIIFPILCPVQTNITVAMNHKKESISVCKYLFTKTADQIEEFSDRKVRGNYDDNSKKIDLVENDSKEDDIQSIKCDWSKKDFHTDCVNRKNQIEKDMNSENYVHMTAPPSSPKRLEKGEISDSDMLKAFEGRKVEKDNIAFNFHVDTSPILFELKISQVKFLRAKIDLLSKIFGLLGILQSDTVNSKECFRIVTDFDDDTTVKEFLEMDSCSESSSRLLPDYANQLILSIWLQWTVTKITFNLGDFSEHRSNLSVEMEDFIISLDKQLDYLKIKGKLGTFSMRYFKINNLQEIKTDDDLKFNMKANNSDLPFIDVTITIADTKSVFRKIGAHKKADLNNQLYEIIVSIQAFETTINIEKLLEFIPVISFFHSSADMNHKEESGNTNEKLLIGSQLPLIYFDLGGFTVYLPVCNSLANCSVLIINVNEIKLSPNVKNPLTRKPIRSDVYNKAAQMGLLNVRGSIIEDRQYELIFHNISVATGNWYDFLNFIKDHENNLRNANPAFDWNHQNFSKNTFELQEIFNSFIISVTFAPMIVYQKIVVSGQSIEFNCVNDLNARITTEQMKLFSFMSFMVKKLTSSLYNRENTNNENCFNSEIKQMMPLKKTELNASLLSYERKLNKKNLINQIVEERDTDSGISTYEKGKRRNHIKQTKLLGNEQLKHIPYEISFLAGIFTIEFYHVANNNVASKTKKVLEPLFNCIINQPSMLISQKVFEKNLKASLHNLTVNYSLNGKSDENVLINIFDTLPGKLDISGIPPSLFSLKIYDNKLQKRSIMFSFSKPIKINLQHQTIETLANVWIIIENSTKVCPSSNFASNKEIVRGTKLKIIKKNFANADVFSFKLNQLIVKTEEHDKYEIEVILDNFRSEISFLHRPEKISLNLNLDTFYIKTENKICLHPLSIRCDFNLTEEKWSNLPLISGNLKMNVIQIDLGIENLQNVLTAINSFNTSIVRVTKILEVLNKEMKISCEEDFNSKNAVNMNNLEKNLLPKIFLKDYIKNKEEIYQDDLRAGAFQFVETSEDTTLPLPYQIHIITKNHGIICWRYPQPRKIYKMHVFPIPMPVANPIEIKCQVEYFSDLYKKFLLFREFTLSETESSEIELPKRVITANIWRVVILQSLVSINREYFDTSEEDDEVKLIKFDEFDIKNENSFALHPKVLVGCMKIDTCFSKEYIPKVDILLDIPFLELNLQNQQTKANESSNIFKNLRLSNELSSVETFLSFNLKNIKILASFLTNKSYAINSEISLSAKILDYAFSNMQFLLEETNLKNYIAVEKNTALCNFISDIIKINMDPGILHTLVVSVRQWNERIVSTDRIYDPIITRFVVANMVQYSMVFGQTNTNEKIFINSKEYVMYSFISSIDPPNLTFYNPQKLTEFSDSFYVKVENYMKYIKIGESIYIINSKKLSSTQIIITIKGQIDFRLMVNEKFIIQFRNQNDSGTNLNKSPEYLLNETGPISFCHSVVKGCPKSVRIKFDSNKTKLWSGDIPLRTNKNLPWLVKIPISGPHDFVTYWFRIISEEIVEYKTSSQTPLRIMIMIWPVYQIRSFFPKKLTFNESSTNAEMEIPERANILDLKVPATHETEHVITFSESFPTVHGESRQTCNLSLKNIDWNQFFNYDEKKWSIESCLMELEKKISEDWPYKNEEESKIYRKSICDDSLTIPVLKIGPSRELSCSLLLEVAPWCTFINSLSSSIKIKCITTQNIIQIPSNELSKIFPINCGFTIEIDCSTGWVKSLPIYFDNALNVEKKISQYISLKDNDEVEIMFFGNIMHKAILKSVMDNGRKILIIKPVFVLVNYSNEDFYFIPFCVQYNHKVTRQEVMQLTANHGIQIQKKTTNAHICGLAVDAFYNLSTKRNSKNKDVYNFWVVMYYQEGEDITAPVDFAKAFNRKCVSLQKNNNSIALSINCLEKDGQYYMNIFNDSLPALEIYNSTDLNFLIAQTDSNENSADAAVKFECNNCNFEWFQILKNKSTLYYTPPEEYSTFPDNGNVINNILLSFFNEESSDKMKSLRWSKPLRTNISCEKFFNIPMFGDVKVIVCVKHKITKITISYIAEQLEFSVKDLRSRLISPSRFQHKEIPSFRMIDQHILQEQSYKRCSHDLLTNTDSTDQIIDFNIFIKEIILCFSTINDKENFDKTEILAIYFDDLITKYNSGNKTLQLTIPNLQIDNQQFSSCKYDFPVVLSSQDVSVRTLLLPSIFDLHSDLNTYEEKALVKLKLQFRKNREILELTSILCKIKPIRAYVEDTYINDLLEFLSECSIENLIFYHNSETKKQILSKGNILIPDEIVNRASYLADPIRLDYFRIEPLSVLFSVHTCIRFYIALDHSPLELAAFERRNITTLPIRLGYIAGMHYLSGALFGAGWVVGSLEILGSPSGLARCFSTGIRDFVTLPLEGFFRGPWGFIMGVTQGSVSLLRNITAGTVNSVTKLASSVARNIDRLTCDEEHFQRTEIIRRTRPQGFAEGLSQGLTSLGINILGAVGGLARHPLEAQNPVQIVTGVGKGIVGAITKPISGAAELVALTGHGVLHTVGFNTQPKQRFPANNRFDLSPANSKIWKLLPRVLKFDQILFFHEATLVVEKKLKRVTICMTSTVLAILELDKNELTYVLPIDRLIASFDENDSSLINVNLKPKDVLVDEFMNKQFARRRIMDFLRSSRTPDASRMSVGSLEDLLIADKLSTKLDWSFYISENLGHHLLQYLKIVTPHSSKDIRHRT